MATIPLAGQAQSASPLRLYVLAIVIAVVAEALGPLAIPLGIGKVVLLPMIWALLIGLALGIWQQRLPAATRVHLPTQFLASAVLQPALLIFIAKLGLLVGGALPKLAEAGWGLLLQEFGNLFGCVLLGMPVALLLGIKREAVGATFSIGREPGLAIIGEKFGMDSPEGRGVLAEYVTGTLIGAIFISIFAGFVTSLNLFHPLALAMGAGVGSGSMTAAAVGAIAAQQTPEVAKDVAAFAAASNLIATTVGTYMTLFISLPFAVWAYRVLEPVLGRGRDRGDKGAIQLTETEKQAAGMIVPDLKWLERLLAWCVVGFMVLLGNRVGFGVPILEALPGVALMVGAVVIGDLIYRGLGRKIPAVCWVSLVAMGMTFPGFPLASTIAELTGKVSFLALITPMLTFAGLSLAKDLPAFRRLGWRIVVVSLLANAGVFLGAAFIAQFFVHTL
ncbi:membrane protein, putative [plant metagenome]|uniref:Membrane protein, putative n=1 Tax=plant metagenome TaxID=1297885 RepID=A0A484TU18_9ZZZZ